MSSLRILQAVTQPRPALLWCHAARGWDAALQPCSQRYRPFVVKGLSSKRACVVLLLLLTMPPNAELALSHRPLSLAVPRITSSAIKSSCICCSITACSLIAPASFVASITPIGSTVTRHASGHPVFDVKEVCFSGGALDHGTVAQTTISRQRRTSAGSNQPHLCREGA